MTDGTGTANIGAYGGIQFISRYGSTGTVASYNNLGTYLRRSFRFFEDPNYIPTIAQQERLTKSIQRSFLSSSLSHLSMLQLIYL